MYERGYQEMIFILLKKTSKWKVRKIDFRMELEKKTYIWMWKKTDWIKRRRFCKKKNFVAEKQFDFIFEPSRSDFYKLYKRENSFLFILKLLLSSSKDATNSKEDIITAWWLIKFSLKPISLKKKYGHQWISSIYLNIQWEMNVMKFFFFFLFSFI